MPAGGDRRAVTSRRFAAAGGRVVRRILAAAPALLGAAGCGWWGSDERSAYPYLNAEPGTPLEVPADLANVSIDDTWPIPEIDDHPLARVFPSEAPRPEIFVGREDRDAVKIQRLGERRWVVVIDPPELVWPVVKQFLTDAGVEIVGEDPPSGVIDGAWLDLSSDDSGDVLRSAIRDARGEESVGAGRDRVRFRIEQGIRRGSTEIHVRHENDAVAAPVETFPPQSAIAAAEEGLLSEFGSYYAAGVASQTVSMVGRDVATESKARVERNEAGYPILRLNVDFDRAWATVGQALRRAEVEVTSADRDSAVIDAIMPVEGNVVARLIPALGGGAQPQAVSIRINEDGTSYIVDVVGPDGNPAGVELSERVLALLREYAA